jgi:hypothetical protein
MEVASFGQSLTPPAKKIKERFQENNERNE